MTIATALLLDERTPAEDAADDSERRTRALADAPGILTARLYAAVPGWGAAGAYDADLARRQSGTPLPTIVYADARDPADSAVARGTLYRPLPTDETSNAADLDVCGPFVMLNWWDAQDDETVAVMDEWWNAEHMPILMRTPGRLRIRRFERIPAEGPRRFLVIHDLASLDVLTHENESAVLTEWRERAIVGRRDFGRGIYRLALRADAAGVRS